MLENEVITEPRHFKGEHFTGNTVLAFNARGGENNLFEDCTFEGPGRSGPFKGGAYALKVANGFRPYTTFRNCDFGHADKVVAASWCGFFDCDFHHGHDAFFGYQSIHIEGGRSHSIGGLEGDHPDGFQMAAGFNVRIKRHHFDLDTEETNACVFLRPQLGPIDRVSVVQCKLAGGNYLIYVDKGNYGYPTNIFLAGNQVVGSFRYGAVREHKGHEPYQRNNGWQGEQGFEPPTPPRDDSGAAEDPSDLRPDGPVDG